MAMPTPPSLSACVHTNTPARTHAHTHIHMHAHTYIHGTLLAKIERERKGVKDGNKRQKDTATEL